MVEHLENNLDPQKDQGEGAVAQEQETKAAGETASSEKEEVLQMNPARKKKPRRNQKKRVHAGRQKRLKLLPNLKKQLLKRNSIGLNTKKEAVFIRKTNVSILKNYITTP